MAELNLEWIEAGSLKTRTISPNQVTHQPGMTRLGRDPNRCDVVLADGSVSGLHIQIGWDATQGFFVENLRESNPPIVNNQPLTSGRANLLSENTIQLGNLQIRAVVTQTSAPISNAIPETEIQIPSPGGNPPNSPYGVPPAQGYASPPPPQNYSSAPPTTPPPYGVPPQSYGTTPVTNNPQQYNYSPGTVAADSSESKGSKNPIVFVVLGSVLVILFALAWPSIRSFLGISDSSVLPDSSSQTESSENGDSSSSELSMANLVAYEHPSGLFSIDIPDDWNPVDNSQAGEILIQGWGHPQQNAYVILRIFAADATWTRQEVQDFSERLVDDLFSEFTSYAREDSEWLDNDRSRVFWQAELDGDFVAAATFAKQDGLNVSSLTVWIPEDAENFDALLSDIDKIILSLDVDSNIDIP